ncbi:MLX-interacting protein [Microcaecilia unicolor]|uniref:MLX-interacting protein n=1 Tax=Microcaecilia unicolor TaxID=1415580 RepID=A0A6P7ZNZ3_9AMPH|nr:MLX-interacting protein [Microcaecilia unicolor]
MMTARAAPAFRCRAPVIVKQEADDDSDTDEPNLLLKKSDSPEPQIIHSGHFMVSSPHSEHPPKKGYDFDTVNKQTCQTYSFGKASACHLSIDASLTKLFECMTLAYSGKLVSPKWKNFKGLKLQWRDKIRLNNAIWRAWYMQYLERRKNPVCHFVTPLDGSVDIDDNRRPEAIATEGKYWKRRIEIVIREYHKWRTYFKKRLQKHKDEDLSILVKDDDLVFWQKSSEGRETPVPMEEEQLLDMDMLMAEFSDTLFSTLSSHQPLPWPNPREIAHAWNADMIQPGLIPLQPNLDLMDTLEPFPDLFSFSRFQSGISLTPAPAPASAAAPTTTPASPLCTNSQSSQPAVLPDTLSPVNLDVALLASPGPAPVASRAPDIKRERSASLGSIGSAGFNLASSLSNQRAFISMFSPPVLPVQPALPPSPTLSSQTLYAPPDPAKFALCNSSVITHTDSTTLTQNAAATTFNPSPGLLLAAQQQVPHSIALQTVAVQQQPRPSPQAQLKFSTAKAIPVAKSRARAKQPQKIVPVPQPETVSLVLKNAFIAPAAFQGQPRAVIVSPGPLKPERILSPHLSQPNMLITPAGITRAPGQTEFHSSVLVGSAQPAPGGSQAPSVVSNLFSSTKMQDDSLGKGQQISAIQTSSRECQNSGQGSPCASEQSLSPQSPQSSCTGKSTADSQTVAFKSQRMKHISAEQKRRFNIRIGFSTLHSLLSTSTKPISHAITLQKTVEYIGKLQQERVQLQEETKHLREEVEKLNTAINSCQQQLPETGVPISRQRFDHMQDMYEQYVKNRTLQNWKFWIFSIIIKPLFESFNGMVSTTSFNDLYQTTLSWLEQHCSLPVLRPMVLNTLRHLSTTTSILSDPSGMAQEATQAVIKSNKNTGAT